MSTTRWHPVPEVGLLPALGQAVAAIRAAGLEVCAPREECDIHPGEPGACYRCL